MALPIFDFFTSSVRAAIDMAVTISVIMAVQDTSMLPMDMVEVGIKLGIDFAPAPNNSCARFSRR